MFHQQFKLFFGFEQSVFSTNNKNKNIYSEYELEWFSQKVHNYSVSNINNGLKYFDLDAIIWILYNGVENLTITTM